MALRITVSMSASFSSLYGISSECWWESTTVATCDGLPFTYWTDTWHLPSGRRKGSVPSLRAFAAISMILCARLMGAGIRLGRLVARVAEHHALVTGAHLVVKTRAVDALRDVG